LSPSLVYSNAFFLRDARSFILLRIEGRFKRRACCCQKRTGRRSRTLSSLLFQQLQWWTGVGNRQGGRVVAGRVWRGWCMMRRLKLGYLRPKGYSTRFVAATRRVSI
jgi:hypothetical protein